MILREYLRAFPRFSRDSWLILATAGLGGFSYQGIYFLLAMVDGLVSLKGGICRVVIRQLRILGR